MAAQIVSTVAGQLLSATKDDIWRLTCVKKELENISSNLQTIQHVLDDAEKRSMKDEAVQGWLEKLKEISYDMEDVLDEWNTAICKRKSEEAKNPSIAGEEMSCSSLFTCLLFKLDPCFHLKQVGLCCKMAWKIKHINAKLELIIKEKNDFTFAWQESLPNRSTFDSLESDRITTSFINESEVYGRDHDEETLLSKLLSESSQGETRIPIISIVGTGGLGKTTLAKVIYNNGEVKKRFSERIWVCVSDPFDSFKIAQEIVEAIEGNPPNVRSKELLLQRLKETISNKNFLLVLDDVWDEKGKKWEELRNCLEAGDVGSRVLLTTRKEKVASMMGTSRTNVHHLGILSQLDSCSLFCKLAFAEKKDHEMQVREIGGKIVGKCKGLPLAIKTIGNLLRFKYTFEEWKQVLDSEIWQLEEMEEDVFPHLYLSYKELPSIVKRCFLYCSIFQKDTKLDVDELIRFWLAQGFVKSTNGRYDKELKGKEHFNKLVMCSFFQDFEKDDLGNIMSCKMHDIVHDFAQYLARNECITIENVKSSSYRKGARHFTWFPGHLSACDESLFSACDVGRLRTFIVDVVACSTELPVTLFNHLKHVRVLKLRNCGLKKLPEDVGSLFHLRCLDLSSNSLDGLPESVCELYNLETLNLKNCTKLSVLPQRIGKLINLKELFLYGTSLREYPESFHKLNIRILDMLLVGKRSEDGHHFKLLRTLEIRAGNDSLEIDDLELNVEIATLEAQQPLLNVHELRISGISGTHFWSWLVKAFNNLKQLLISGCNCSTLPALGKLPNLEFLWMGYMDNIERIGREFLGIPDDDSLRRAPASSSSVRAFPKLWGLVIDDFRELQVWEETDQADEDTTFEIMPQLRRLQISRCPKLYELPNWLRAKLSTLQQYIAIVGCPNLIRSYPELNKRRQSEESEIAEEESEVSEEELLENKRFQKKNQKQISEEESENSEEEL